VAESKAQGKGELKFNKRKEEATVGGIEGSHVFVH